jgi:HemY protein
MIWALGKVLLFILIVSALTLGAGILLDTGGGIRIAAAGYEFSLGPLQALIAFFVMVVLVWLLMKLVGLIMAVFRFLNGDETAISRYFDRNREKKGFQALSEGLIALAAGEGRLALNRAIKAEKYLADPHLTTLLVAQAAEAAGDTRRATEAYKELLGSETTRFVAIRGLIKQKLTEGDTETAQKLAVKALELKPRHEETQDILLKLQAESRDWKGARSHPECEAEGRCAAAGCLSAQGCGSGLATSAGSSGGRRNDRSARGGDRGQSSIAGSDSCGCDGSAGACRQRETRRAPPGF